MRQLLLTFISIFIFQSIYGQVIYVDHNAEGANNGISWHDAFSSLPDALESASGGESIWISQGTYTLETKESSFVIDKDLRIYGGFKGNETMRSQRDYENYITDLSADVLGDDDYTSTMDNKDENSNHVIIIEAGLDEVILDGLTIRGGMTQRRAEIDLETNEGNGAGILNLGSPMILRNSKLYEHNATNLGGAIYLDSLAGVEIEIENCHISDSRANLEGGAIMVNTDNTSLSISNSVFENNASFRGGAVRFRGIGSTIHIDDSEFKNCTVTGWGGALSINTVLACSIIDCEITANRAWRGGGGIYLYNIGESLIERSAVSNNVVGDFGNISGFGGGIYADNDPETLYGMNLIIKECQITNNKCSNIGAGINLRTAIVSIENSNVSDNEAGNAGGGVSTFANADLLMDNVEMTNNSARFGGAVYYISSGEYLIENCEFNNNTAEVAGGSIGMALDEGGLLTIENSIFNSNKAGEFGGAMITYEGDFTINDSEFYGNTAAEGGAISNNFGAVTTVSGSYFLDNQSTGFGGAIADFEGGKVKLSNTDFKNNNSEYGGAINTFRINELEIDSSTFFNNQGSLVGGAINVASGGDIFINNSEFYRNRSEFVGAVNVDDLGTAAEIKNSHFERNIATVEGGAVGIYYGAQLKMYSSEFHKNDSHFVGGALIMASDNVAGANNLIEACVFEDNRAYQDDDGFGGAGSAAIIFNENVKFQNNLFNNNYAAQGGTVFMDAYDINSDQVSFVNNTFANNNNRNYGTLLTWDDQSGDQVNLELQNNIFADDNIVFNNVQGEANVNSDGGNMSINDSMVEYFTHEKDQNEVDPEFQNANNNFMLKNTSLAIDAGVSAGAPDKDILGNMRDQAIDIGAYESSATAVLAQEIIPAGVLKILINPVETEVNYTLQSDWSGGYTASVVNVSGQVLWRGTLQKDTNITQCGVDIQDLHAGVYFLNVVKDNKVSTQAFKKI